MSSTQLIAWIDISAGVSGDMLLGAFLDAGSAIDAVQAAVDSVIPGGVSLSVAEVRREGLRAAKLSVQPRDIAAVARSWSDIRGLIERADLPENVRRNALGVFGRLAHAEARVHGVAPDDVHFHEVGALDSIADVVGTCAAIHDLGITEIIASPVALGSGRVGSEHGELPVPVPAVLELSRGWIVSAGGEGELATPTGLALISTLATSCAQLPALRVAAVGVGAGTRDIPGRANVVRVVLGAPELLSTDGETRSDVITLAANVDDLDPRVWPSVLSALLQAGASDAWLAPILMKKGRPAHTLYVLAPDDRAGELRRLIMDQTSTIGVRETLGRKYALPRTWITVELPGGGVRVKVAHRAGVIVQATPEFEDVSALAGVLGVPTRDVLAQANAAAADQGLTRGSKLPDNGTEFV
jgi:uncharacterized protein (TIGR00299 family) protein